MRLLALSAVAVLMGCPPPKAPPDCPHCDQNDDGDGDGFTPSQGDCDDGDSQVHPDAEEICDERDNDCDDEIDVDASDVSTWFSDLDGDGFGDPSTGLSACVAPAQTVAEATDCDDGDVLAFPGAIELCDLVDNNCDGVVDEGTAVDASSWYLDSDGDGHGAGAAVVACFAPDDHAASDDDCDDDTASVNPFQIETCDDGLDNDCDGSDNGCIKVGRVNLDVDGELVDVWSQGRVENGVAGSAILSIPDIDGDGLPDVAVTSGQLNDTVTGQVFLLAAGHWEEAELTLALGQPGVVGFVGTTQPADQVGAALDASAEDGGVLALGAPGGGGGAGVVYIVSLIEVSGGIILPSSEHMTAEFQGAPGTSLGVSLAFGHFDGDDDLDVLLGAPGFQADGVAVGGAYIVSGPLNGGSENIADMDTIELRGVSPGGGAGGTVTALADMNGDGVDDFALGAPSAGTEGDGRVYVIWGEGEWSPASILTDSDGILSVSGGSEQGLGSALGDAGDVDGDGLVDLLVGASSYDGNRGRAYVVFGTSGLLRGDITDEALMLNGDSGTDLAGASVAGVGDMNGDGFADICVGAPGHAGSSGRAYLLYGPFEPGTIELSEADLILEGETEAGRAGSVVAAAGDMDGDGFNGLLIGEPYPSQLGGVYLIQGRGW